jgi:hypothetical protein
MPGAMGCITAKHPMIFCKGCFMSKFTKGFKAEWNRVYPTYPLPPQPRLRDHFMKGMRDGLIWYFAPARLVWWVLTLGWRR